MKAMLLAAGTGSRLRPLTDTVPKPLAPIANSPLLFRTLSWLAGEGITEVMINLHHHADKIRAAIGDGDKLGILVRYSVEEDLLGTSGAVGKCAEFFQEEPFFVIYGDNLIDAELKPLFDFHRSRHAAATIALFVPDDPSASGMVELDESGKVSRFVEKPKPGKTDATMANAGIYVLDPGLLTAIPYGFSDFGHDIFPTWLKDGRPVYADELRGYLQDTGTPDRYRKANWDVMSGKLRMRPHGGMVGDALIGNRSFVSPSAVLTARNIVGSDCRVGDGSRLEGCILWDRVSIGRNCELSQVVVGEGALVADGTVAADTILV